MCTFGLSGCRVRAPAARSGGAAGVSHDNPRAQTCTFEGVPAFKNTTKIQREDPQEREERMNENGSGRGKKKREIFGGLAEEGPAEGGPGRGSRAGGPAQGVSGGGNEKKIKKSKHLKNN